jgi:hypothetical protein
MSFENFPLRKPFEQTDTVLSRKASGINGAGCVQTSAEF